ncbi:PD-(D/E)XK nuclease-like domain-containing protein [Streptococcus danieliae]|uniref:PD-(D/E)XK nuclease-like domain-containing protein n=1 Tax=Streptococcus danieliae TaxID=747656 RepID=UPI0021C93554|nr:PD-(D/E)XK nuclease-like domain-containing protein [Streptococcus danieliae]MCU0082227.1 PD-(D/E)XK nuclease-like domain-containing protein [Streptococcus danieliae]
MLTQENYYQDRTYLTNSRIKQYMNCQAMAKAIEDGDWVDERDDTALLLGNYVHSYFESEEAHQQFLEENGDKLISKTGRTKGQLKKDFLIGDKMIQTLETDERFNKLYHGQKGDQVEKEMIVYGELEGIPFKGKLDSVNLTRGYFVDLKTMKSIYADEWNSELRTRIKAAANNILNFGYAGQLALYRELLKQITGDDYRQYIVAVSKENVPDKEVLSIPENFLEEGLGDLLEAATEIWDVIQGKKEPKKCERCDYCRSKKKLTKIVSLNELIGE